MAFEDEDDFFKENKDFDKGFKRMWWIIIVLAIVSSLITISIVTYVAMNSDKIYQSAKTSIIHEIKDIKHQLKD